MKLQEVNVIGSDGTAVTLFEKRLSARERNEPEATARLRAEADLLRVLGGHVTPRLVDAGEDERGPWLRTERIPFPVLAHRLEEHAERGAPALDTPWVERAVRAAFGALAELHDAFDERGPLLIVHADVSPANLAVDDAGTRAVLLDLELASWRGAPGRDGAFRGTVAYCSPEVARGETPTVASDLFALAATLLHAVTGAPPRSGTLLAAVLANAAEQPLLDPAGVTATQLAARGPGHAAIVRCLAHLPHERPASAREVLASLGSG
jgi:serine/threonine protein kinase